MGNVYCMTDGSINTGVVSWRTRYEGVLGYLTIFKKNLYEGGQGKISLICTSCEPLPMEIESQCEQQKRMYLRSDVRST